MIIVAYVEMPTCKTNNNNDLPSSRNYITYIKKKNDDFMCSNMVHFLV